MGSIADRVRLFFSSSIRGSKKVFVTQMVDDGGGGSRDHETDSGRDSNGSGGDGRYSEGEGAFASPFMREEEREENGRSTVASHGSPIPTASTTMSKADLSSYTLENTTSYFRGEKIVRTQYARRNSAYTVGSSILKSFETGTDKETGLPVLLEATGGGHGWRTKRRLTVIDGSLMQDSERRLSRGSGGSFNPDDDDEPWTIEKSARTQRNRRYSYTDTLALPRSGQGSQDEPLTEILHTSITQSESILGNDGKTLITVPLDDDDEQCHADEQFSVVARVTNSSPMPATDDANTASAANTSNPNLEVRPSTPTLEELTLASNILDLPDADHRKVRMHPGLIVTIVENVMNFDDEEGNAITAGEIWYTKAEVNKFRTESNEESFKEELKAAQANLKKLGVKTEFDEKEDEINNTIAMLLESGGKTWDYGEETMMSPTKTGKKTWDKSENRNRTGSMNMFYMDDDGMATFDNEDEADEDRTWEKKPRSRRGTLRSNVRTKSKRKMNDSDSEGGEDSEGCSSRNNSRRNSLRSVSTNHSRRNTFTRGSGDSDDFDFDVLAMASAAKAETVAAILSAEAIYDQKHDAEES